MANSNTTMYIYILSLQEGRYYIGKTIDVIKRYQEHLNGIGSLWTRKYPPISLEKSFPMSSPFDEDKYTKEYMAKYGIDKVRGGAYIQEKLTNAQIETLRLELRAATDKCIKCGLAGHFADSCTFKVSDTRYPVRCSITVESVSKRQVPLNVCYRCGRKGHFANKCFAKTHLNGTMLS